MATRGCDQVSRTGHHDYYCKKSTERKHASQTAVMRRCGYAERKDEDENDWLGADLRNSQVAESRLRPRPEAVCERRDRYV